MLEAILSWDVRTFHLINKNWVSPALDRLLPFVTDARTFTIPFVVAAIVILLVGRMRGVRFLVLAIVSVIVADAIGNYVLKQTVLRTRPCIALEGIRLLVGCTHSPSFPANHAINASALGTLVMLSMPRLWLPAAALAIAVGYSRVYVGVHYPLDVLAGGLMGITLALVFSGLMTLLWPSRLDERRLISSLTMRGS